LSERLSHAAVSNSSFGKNPVDNSLFEKITDDIVQQGYSINPNALPNELASALFDLLKQMRHTEIDAAGIGRKKAHMVDEFVRTDEICWINGDSEAGKDWLIWTSELRQYLNSQLFLGLFSFESHFAHYAPGQFYKKHLDAFKGESNRVLSIVVYLNHDWAAGDAGELVLYKENDDLNGTKILPNFGTLVAFLSEDFPHEVLPAKRDRYSIAGWFRLNTTSAERIDPPR